MDKKKIQKIVREAYGKIAQGQKGCECGTCGPDTKTFTKSVGYSEEELKVIPEEANLALSCGNATALACLKEVRKCLTLVQARDLIVFLAASRVGANGKVIGVDMTPETVEKAGETAGK